MILQMLAGDNRVKWKNHIPYLGFGGGYCPLVDNFIDADWRSWY